MKVHVALVPQFQLLLKLEELSKQGVDVSDVATRISTPDDQSTCTAERDFAI